jgi:hypothetical protein
MDTVACSNEIELSKEIIGITFDQQAFQPESRRGEISRFYTLERGMPTSTTLTRIMKDPKKHSSLAHQDTTT